jgi:hypothetical protein
MKSIKKSVLAASLATGMMVAGTAQSYIIGPPGEALLYPFVYYDRAASIDTFMALHTTSFLGVDTVPNEYTAPNVWNAGNPNQPARPVIHWFWFDYKSKKQLSGTRRLTLDDKLVINLEQLGATTGHSMERVPGYFVVVDDATTTNNPPAGSFAMMGDAALVAGGDITELPVLPMVDGADGAVAVPSNTNNCVWDSKTQAPLCSPIVAGTRRDDGIIGNDVVVVDVELAPLQKVLQTLIVWQDYNPGGIPVPIDRFDDEEIPCNDTIYLPWEVNVVPLLDPYGKYPDFGWWGEGPTTVDPQTLCVPFVARPELVGTKPGILRMYLHERSTDVNVPGPNSSLVVFTITSVSGQASSPVADTTPSGSSGLVTHLGHDLGIGQP